MTIQPKETYSSKEKILKAFSMEPLGGLLVDWLHLPLSFVGALFAFLYFGVLLILHVRLGHPFPATLRELLQNPSTSYYYPNLVGITYDLIGNPIYFVLLVYIRKDIPKQLNGLFHNDFLVEKKSLNLHNRAYRLLLNNKFFLFLYMVFIPLLLSIRAVVSIIYNSNGSVDLLEGYDIILVALGVYASTVIFLQLIFAIIVLYSFSFSPKLLPRHPDQCSGTAALGNLAILSYLFIFTRALFQSVAFAARPELRGALELWLIFPLLLIIVFELLVYQPHKVLVNLQREYLEKSSDKWTSHYVAIAQELEQTIDIRTNKTSNKKEALDQAIKILESWTKFDTYISDMNTWPISSSTFRVVSIITNPLIPLLLPIVIELIKSALS